MSLSHTNMKSPEQFAVWREDVLAFHRKAVRIEQSHRPAPLNTAITDEVSVCGGVTRRRIEYDTTDGLRIPAFLFVPDTKQPVPAVTVYHGHGDGKINAAERSETNENALAKYLAEKLGYVVLSPDSRSFGEFEIPGARSHAGYYSSLMARGELFMTKLMQDGFQDMALLREAPEVDTGRIGAAGISMGSWRALNHAAMHEEIAAAVVAGLFIPWNQLFSELHCACQHIPELQKEISAEDLAASIFPRRLMIQWGLDDKYYYSSEAEGLIARTAKIAEFIGCPNLFTVDRRPGMGHGFSNPEIAAFFHGCFGDGAWQFTS